MNYRVARRDAGTLWDEPPFSTILKYEAEEHKTGGCYQESGPKRCSLRVNEGSESSLMTREVQILAMF